MGIFKKDAYDDQLRLRNALAPCNSSLYYQYLKMEIHNTIN